MRTSALSLMALAQLLVVPAWAQAPFDGTWDVAVMSKAGSCESSVHYQVTVQDGKIFGPGDVSWRVTSDGYVRVSINGSYANGQLDGRAGSGRWSAPSCSGRWKATRE
jgi:hypothetical protein